MGFRIKKLDIFIVKQFALLFVGAFFICQFVLMMQALWQYIDDLVGKGLSIDIMAQFFWYMGLTMVPQALPLAILLSSLITFGNLGESSELTAIKAAGTSLVQAFRSLIFITILLMFTSFYFQNRVGPNAMIKTAQLMLSMKQKSPELEIPEGVFYDGIPNTNIYVQKKNLETGKLYGIMIYLMTGSYEDQAIILADSGMLQSTAEKKHLVLSLWSGEWFQNMQTQEFSYSAAVPYRRESFVFKKIVRDFDGDFNLMDASALSSNARTKGLNRIFNDIDSLNLNYDSIGRGFYTDLNAQYYRLGTLSRSDSLKAIQLAMAADFNIDSVLAKMPMEKRRQAVNMAMNAVNNEMQDLEFKSMITSDGDKMIRQHKIEAINKFTTALTCLIFFFIGAPLGAIIRKGGLGIPVIISVLVFIIYYILDNTGYQMARRGMWAIWFGKLLAPATLTPLAVFVTYKANNDSVVFNLELWQNFLYKLLGMRLKRHIFGKEVIINNPDYAADGQRLTAMNKDIAHYSTVHRLKTAPNFINVFFRYQPDHEVERINDEMESVIEDLSNTRDKTVLSTLNHYPIVSPRAHTRPFERTWMNVMAALIVPLGLVLYVRMWMFRLRLAHDLKAISQANEIVITRCEALADRSPAVSPDTL